MYPSGKLDRYPEYNTYMPQVGPGRTGNPLRNEQDAKYIVTTKIMVLALAVLFAVVFFVICLHIYAKWIWRVTPARGSPSFSFWPIRRRRNRASPGDEIVLDADVLDINMVMGLGKSAVEALPKFMYKTAEHVKSAESGDRLECAICLGKFEEDEMGRALPKCGHTFHLECIDMWLYSHSTCPLCRAILEPDEDESISLNFETPSIQIFHLEPTTGTTPRRLRGADPADHNLLPQLLPRDRTPPDQPLAESDQPPQPEDTANKRADAIPANVLFWGTQASAESRLSSTVVNNNSPRAPSQLVIDIDIAEPDPHHDHLPNSTVAAPTIMPRTVASFHRLLGRTRLPAPPADEVVEMFVRPFRPSPLPWSPSPSPAPSPAPSPSPSQP